MSMSPSASWKMSALSQIFRDRVAVRDSDVELLRPCLVRQDCVDPTTGKISPSKNHYRRVRIEDRDLNEHVAVLVVIENRFPRREGDSQMDEVGLHLCNNPACCEATHLKFGTVKENAAYMIALDRAATGKKNGHYTKPEMTPANFAEKP